MNAPEPLLRELLGHALRTRRHEQGRTLAQVAAKAGISMQHLSDVERGRKDASSEVLAAACGALGLTLGDVLRDAGAHILPATVPTQPSARTHPVSGETVSGEAPAPRTKITPLRGEAAGAHLQILELRSVHSVPTSSPVRTPGAQGTVMLRAA